MKNSVRANATFSFKGETHTPSVILDLDEFLKQNRRLDDIYALLAKQGKFDPYSYEHEMLLSAPLVFDQPKGLAEKFVQDGQLNLQGLRTAWSQEKLQDTLTTIARQHMGIEQLEDVPGLRETLLAVYKLTPA